MTEETTAPAAPETTPQIDGAMDTVPSTESKPSEGSEQTSPPPSEGTKPRSRMESLQKAFDTLDKGEKTEAKTDAGPKADGERPRNPDGTFAKAPEKPQEAKPEEGQKPPEAKAPIGDAPARFSADAKAAWKDAPESVRGEIQRAVTELESGLRQKDEQLAPLKPYMDMAQKHGTTVDAALQNYVNMENMLRQDPAKGLQALARNMGMTPEQMAGHLTGQQSETQKDQQIASLMREIDGLKQQVHGVSQNFQQSQESAIAREVEQFASNHPRFDELEEEMAKMIQTGYATDLADAYEKADRLNPVLQAAPPPPPPPQTREPQSVTGAPNAGSNPGNRQPSKTRTEALSRAFGQVGL